MSFPLRATTLVLAVTFVFGQLTKPFPVSAAPTQTPETSFEHFLQVHAAVSPKGALVEWRTGLERDTLGFNAYRIKNGERTRLNPELIAGSALVVRGRPQAYSWFDKQGTIGCVYEVEIIDLKGQSAAHISADAIWQTVLPDFQQAELLSQLGGASRTATAQPDFSEIDDAKAESLTAASFAGESLSEQWAIANQPALKIGVRADGWYR